MRFQHFLKHLLTGKDKKTYDITRVLMFLGGLVFLVCTLFEVVHTLQFDMEKFGYGFGSLIGGGSIGLGAKANTEPGEEPRT